MNKRNAIIITILVAALAFTTAYLNYLPFKTMFMPLEKKVGQLFILSLSGDYENFKEKNIVKAVSLIEKYNIGGIRIFDGEKSKVINLINHLQSKSKIPLFISGDFERGLGCRIEGGICTPRAMHMASHVGGESTMEIAKIFSREAKQMGFNMIFAPVTDINTNPNNPIINIRAFGDTPETVSKHVTQFIRGAHSSGVALISKHFPGHGDVHVNSHLDLPHIKIPLEELRKREFIPFKAAIDAGVDGIMVSHLLVDAIDAEIPASLSSKTIQKVLRKELGFKGLVVGDSFSMDAIGKMYTPSDVVSLGVTAGINLFLVDKNFERHLQAALLLSRKEELKPYFQDSISRIMHQKNKIEASLPEDIQLSPQDVKIVDASFSNGFVLYQNKKNLTYQPEQRCRISVFFDANASELDKKRHVTNIKKANEPLKCELPSEKLPNKPLNFKGVRQYLIIIRSPNAKATDLNLTQSETTILQQLEKSKDETVVFVFGNPYLLSKLTSFSTLISSPDPSTKAVELALTHFINNSPFLGKLPIEIPVEHQNK